MGLLFFIIHLLIVIFIIVPLVLHAFALTFSLLEEFLKFSRKELKNDIKNKSYLSQDIFYFILFLMVFGSYIVIFSF